MTYTFGSFRLDTARRLLFSGGEIAPVPERAFQLLLLLIEAGGDVVTKETLSSKVWPETAVSDGNLSQHIYLLRRLLCQRASDRSYIVTVFGLGFRFGVPVTVSANEEATIEVRSSAEMSPAAGPKLHDPLWEYCRGVQLLERSSASQLWSAIEAFENAVRLNDMDARYFVALARGYSLLAELGYASGMAAFTRARAAIGRAITMDPSSASAHAMLSEILLFDGWDWNGARGAADHALRLDPRSAFVRRNAARFFLALGDYVNAQAEAQRALILDPSSVALQILFAQAALRAGDFDRAIAVLSNLIELHPNCRLARRHRAEAFLVGGRPKKAIRDLLAFSQVDEANSTDTALLSRAFAEAGDIGEARKEHAALLEATASDYNLRLNLAVSAMGLGEEREAMQHLEGAYRRRQPNLVFLKSLLWFEPLRNNPKYVQLIANIGPNSRRNYPLDLSRGRDNFARTVLM